MIEVEPTFRLFFVFEKRISHIRSEPLHYLMSPSSYTDIKKTLTAFYLSDVRPWLVGFSGGKDSTMVASLIFDVVAKIPIEQRTKPISVVCTITHLNKLSY